LAGIKFLSSFYALDRALPVKEEQQPPLIQTAMETDNRPKDHAYNNPEDNAAGDSLSDWVDENTLGGEPSTGFRKTDDSDQIDAAAESEIGTEIYDYGDSGGPDASSSGLRGGAAYRDDEPGAESDSERTERE